MKKPSHPYPEEMLTLVIEEIGIRATMKKIAAICLAKAMADPQNRRTWAYWKQKIIEADNEHYWP